MRDSPGRGAAERPPRGQRPPPAPTALEPHGAAEPSPAGSRAPGLLGTGRTGRAQPGAAAAPEGSGTAQPRDNREPLNPGTPSSAPRRPAPLPAPARPESAAPAPPAPLTSHRSPRGHCRPPRSCPNKRRAAPRPAPPRAARSPLVLLPVRPHRGGPGPAPSPCLSARHWRGRGRPPARREVIGRRGGAGAGQGRVGKGVVARRAHLGDVRGRCGAVRCGPAAMFRPERKRGVRRRADPERLGAPGGVFARNNRGERSAARGGVSPKGRTRPVLSPVGGRARFGSVCCRRGGGRPPGAGRSVAEVPCPVLGR